MDVVLRDFLGLARVYLYIILTSSLFAYRKCILEVLLHYKNIYKDSLF